MTAGNKLSVALIDDDLAPVTTRLLGEEVYKLFSDDSSPEYREAVKFLSKLGTFPSEINLGDVESVRGYFETPSFVKHTLNNPEFVQSLPESSQETINGRLEAVSEVRQIFEVIGMAFPGDRFDVKKFPRRPDEPKELSQFNLVIMDVMIDGQQNSVEEASDYLYKVTESVQGNNFPLFMLISSRPELESHRAHVRNHAKISPLGIAIIAKSELSGDSGKNNLEIIFQQMSSSQDAAKVLREFCLEYEKQVKTAWEKTHQTIWNMDFAHLQQVFANTQGENHPFAEHVLDLFGSCQLSHLEASGELCEKLSKMESVIKNKTEKLQSFSKESATAIHQLEASKHCIGEYVNRPVELPDGVANVQSLEDAHLNNMLPFGAMLTCGGEFPSESKALIHCTQQCDLSRNVLKEDMSLVFAEASITKTRPDGGIPIFPKDNVLWWAHPNYKKIIAGPARETIQKLIDESWATRLTVRPDITRQLRQEIFNKLSRIEKAVSIGHSTLNVRFLLKWKAKGKDHNEYWGGNETPTLLQLSKFFHKEVGKPISSFHLLGHECNELVLWVMDHLSRTGLENHVPATTVEKIFRNLPMQEGKKEAKENCTFGIIKDEKISTVQVDKNSPVALLFITD